MMWWSDHWSWWGWLVMTVSMVIFWGLVIWAIVTVIRSNTETRDRAAPRSLTPEDILRDRFARGEIDAEEYHARLDTLRGRTRTPVG